MTLSGMLPAWMRTRIAAIALVGAVMTLVLVGGVFARASAVASGREIVMAVEGFDPRAPLLGHFVQVRVMPDMAEAQDLYGPVWVRLAPAPEPALWRVAGLTKERPTALAPGERAVRAEALRRWNEGVGLEYGVDRVYLAQKGAERAQEALRGDDAGAVALVLSEQPNGALLPKALIVDGQRIELAQL